MMSPSRVCMACWPILLLTVEQDLGKESIAPTVKRLMVDYETQETSYGVLRPPLGSVRLTVIELVAVLLRTGSEEAETAIIASGIVREILAVFLRFPFNSILHHQVCCNDIPYHALA